MKDKQIVALAKCYYCGRDQDLLLSTRLQDISHLDHKVVDARPCSNCEKLMEQGIIIISVRDGESMEGNPPNPYRTGGFWVVTQGAMERIFPQFDWTKNRFTFMEDSVCEKTGLQKPTQNDTSENSG